MEPLALPKLLIVCVFADGPACRGCSSSRRRPSQAAQELHTKTFTIAVAVPVNHISRHLAAPYPWPVLLRYKGPKCL